MISKTALVLMLSLMLFSTTAAGNKLDSLLQKIAIARADTNKAKLMWQVSDIYVNTGDYENSLKYAQECLRLSERLKYDRGIFWGHMYTGIVSLFRTELDTAMSRFQFALQAAKKTNRAGDKGDAYLNIGNVYYLEHNLVNALRYYELSLAEFQRIGEGGVGALTSLGHVYSELGNNSLALEMYKKAGQEYKRTRDRIGYEVVNYAIGELYLDIGDYNMALQYFFESLQIDKETGNKRSMAETFRGIASVYDKQQKYQEALRYYKQADSLFIKLGDKEGLAKAKYNIGLMYSKQGRFEEAEDLFIDVLKIAEDAKVGTMQAYAFQGLSEISYDNRRYSESKTYCVKGLTLASQLALTDLMRDFYRRISRIDSVQMDYKSAYFNHLQYVYWDDSINNEEKDKKFAQQAMQYEFTKKEDSLKYAQALALKRQELLTNNQRTAKNYLIIGIAVLSGLSLLAYRNYKTRQQLKLQTLRNKIAIDLHDDVGSTLSSISIFSQVAQQQSKEVIPALQTIGESSKKMLDAMADIVWTINPENDQFDRIIMRMRNFAYQLLGAKQIDFRFVADSEVSKLKLSMEARKNLYLIFKEATNNMVKYSEATRATYAIKKEDEKLTMTIKDDGKGFDTSLASPGNGLNNMKRRAKEIGGLLMIDSQPGQGTIVKLELLV